MHLYNNVAEVAVAEAEAEVEEAASILR